MENVEPGDEHIRRIASFIHTNEQGLAAAGNILRRRKPKNANSSDSSIFNPLGWFGSSDTNVPQNSNLKPVILSFDAHHLFYLFMRMEGLGLDVGSLDVKVENPSRPMNYINVLPQKERSDAMSFVSLSSSFSAISRLSLGGSWWGRPPPPPLDSELKYIFSSFTRLPALSLHAPEARLIAELANEPAIENALPFDSFKNLNTLEIVDVDPRTIIGWDRLSESLISLTIKKSGLEDVSDVFIGAVMDDQARREGKAGTDRTRRIPKPPPTPSRQSSFHRTQLPDSVPEDAEDIPPPSLDNSEPFSSPDEKELVDDPSESVDATPKPSKFTPLPSLKWAFLRHLSLADNALTFLPSSPLPYLTSLTHLDLSSNLLVSVPPGLSALYNLLSLNLSDNMIDSVLGIYKVLGQVLTLNLSRNRLESICGLERLLALERVDLRHNIIEESAEVGRLATLPNIAEVWIEGNPLEEIEEDYRIKCFDLFGKERKSIRLDGALPTFYEKRYLTSPPPEQMSSSRPPSVAYSPPVVAVGSPRLRPQSSEESQSSPKSSPPTSLPPSNSASPHMAAVRGRRKKNKRIVDLDGGSESSSFGSAPHSRIQSEAGLPSRVLTGASRALSPPRPSVVKIKEEPPKLTEEPVASSSSESTAEDTLASSTITVRPTSPKPKKVSRHSRRQTEFTPSSNSFDDEEFPPPSRSDDPRASMAHRRSATMSRSTARRARVSASVYEPPSNTDGVSSKDGPGAKPFNEAEAFRARIEALRADMGDGWLKVFNQSHLGSPGVPSG